MNLLKNTFIVFFILGIFVHLAADEYKLYMVQNKKLNIRSGPTSHSKKIDTVFFRDILEAKESKNKLWLKTDKGYIYKNAVKSIDRENITTIKTSVNNSRIRSSCDTKHKNIIKDNIPKNTVLHSVLETPKWFVLIDGSCIWKKSVVLW